MIIHDFDIINNLESNRVLLVNPPVYDFRLDWARWHQPTGLLQVANYLRLHKKDIRLIDCLFTSYGQRIPRRKVDTVELAGYKFNKWHFGLSFWNLRTKIKNWQSEGWEPDTVFVTCMNSVWWESTRDTISKLRKLLPEARIVLGGTYVKMESDHAAEHCGADLIFIGNIPDAVNLPPDLSFYQNTPYSAGIYFYTNADPKPWSECENSIQQSSPRPTTDILTEVIEKTELGVHEFLFFDEVIHLEDREEFGEFVHQVGKRELEIRFVLPGNLPPALITQDLARKMRQARFTHLYLHCKLHFGTDTIRYVDDISVYADCVKILLDNKVCKPRQENLAAMLAIGLPYEDLDMVSERLIRLAHIVGSVILVPFQYVPSFHQGVLFDRALGQNGLFSPERFNSKLFPLARLSGKAIEEYLELTRLATLLNSKYRSRTFDFLGDSLAAKLFRQSIETEGWDPFPENKGAPHVSSAGEVIPLKSRVVSKSKA